MRRKSTRPSSSEGTAPSSRGDGGSSLRGDGGASARGDGPGEERGSAGGRASRDDTPRRRPFFAEASRSSPRRLLAGRSLSQRSLRSRQTSSARRIVPIFQRRTTPHGVFRTFCSNPSCPDWAPAPSTRDRNRTKRSTLLGIPMGPIFAHPLLHGIMAQNRPIGQIRTTFFRSVPWQASPPPSAGRGPRTGRPLRWPSPPRESARPDRP